MHARVSEYQVLPNKMKAFVRAAESTLPELRKQEGFRTLLVLGGGKKDPSKAMIVSVWDSLADMRGSEKSLFLYRALSRVMSHSKGMPAIAEWEVYLTEFAAD
jgi:heme-degrading monooxygenase HmoA